jgi:hypothetical protein
MRRDRRRTPSALVGLLTAGVLVAITLGTSTAAAAAVPPSPGPEIVITGSGWGHSVGMSQYGARAMAQASRSAAQILQHYYPGTAVGPDARVPDDKVVLVDVFRNRPQQGSRRVDLRSLGGFDAAADPTSPVVIDLGDGVTRHLPADGTGYGVTHDVAASQYVLHRGGTELARAADSRPVRVNAQPAGANPGVIKVLNLGGAYAGAYLHGTLSISGPARDGSLVPVLDQHMRTYLWGIAEMPSSWEAAALQAQAITARTYAGRIGGVLSATPANQAYAGWDKERTGNAGWQAAVDATGGQAVTYSGELAQTYYSSSHGLGRTEASEDSWAYGAKIPYLQSIDDPWSAGGGNPYNSWEARAGNAAFAGVLGLARVNSVRIVSRTAGSSPRALTVDGWAPDGKRVSCTWTGGGPCTADDAAGRGAGATLRTTLPLTAGGAANGRIRSQQISAITVAPFTDDEDSVHQFNIGAVAASGITQGCTTSTYCPKSAVGRGQMAAFLARALKLPAYTGPDRFSDIATSPQRADINALAAANRIGGFPDGTYRPGSPVTREQMATFLGRAFDVAASSGKDRFTDIADSVHRQRINDVAARGLTGGCTATTYCPKDLVTREQMASFLARATGVGV